MGISREEIEKQKRERLGKENYNINGTPMKIIEYESAVSIWVEFQDEYKAKIHTTWQKFKNGGIKNPYYIDVFDVGYLGQGKYKSRDEEGKKTSAYKCWQRLLERCYDPYTLNKKQTYINCYVCEEWLCFQNFAEWYYENYYECNDERMCLDKDILYKNNKIYSPSNCIFVPQRINNLFTKSDKTRGNYPVGVSYRKSENIFEVACNIFDEKKHKYKRKYLGRFPLNKPFQAFTVYKNFKENYIKQVADEYKDLIPQRLYEALYKYEVEIND